MKTMNKLSISICALAVVAATACDNDPVGDAHKAQTSEAAPVVEQAPSAQAKKYAISEQNSALSFVGAKVTGSHEGNFSKFVGTLDFVGGDPTKSSVTVTIDMSEFKTDEAKLDKHLKSPDFFAIEKFPEAKFVSTKIEKGKKGYDITGNLTLHGVTKSISFPAQIDMSNGDIAVKTEFGINRKDFDIVYPGMPDDLIKDEVLIKLELKPNQA